MLYHATRTGVLLLLSLVAMAAEGATAATAESLVKVFKAGRYSRVARIAGLHADDLRYATRVENLDGLLTLAQAENRIDAVDAAQLAVKFGRVEQGDALLLVCLKQTACDPDTFLRIAQTSRLHAEVILRKPELNPSQAAQEVGALTERVMNRYFESSGWTRVEGQVGRTGFDGLYVKRDGGVVKDVLVAESKYNSSLLDTTNHGTQMSQDWTRRKLVELQQRYPGQAIYNDILRHVDNGNYRSVLWNMKLDDDSLYVKLSKLHSKGGDVIIADAAGTDAADLWAHPTNAFSLKAPQPGFDARMVGWYRAELDAIGSGTF